MSSVVSAVILSWPWPAHFDRFTELAGDVSREVLGCGGGGVPENVVSWKDITAVLRRRLSARGDADDGREKAWVLTCLGFKVGKKECWPSHRDVLA
jgi:hypothetical protein